MAVGRPNTRVSSITQSLPSGYVLARLDPGNGPAQLVKISDLAQQLVASGGLAPGTAPSSGGGGGGSGLWSGALSAVPTSSGTGLTTWANQGGATVADGTSGIVLTAPSGAGDALRIRSMTAPATPYTITALCSLAGVASFVFGGIGFTDGTKIHGIALGVSGPYSLTVQKWTSATAFSANDFGGNGNNLGAPLMWLQIRDDGTNVKFRYGAFGSTGDNADLLECFTVAKTSGFLGGSGYTKICIFLDNNSSGKNALLGVQSWRATA